MEGAQPCVTDADNAIVQFIECKPLRNYDRSNSECQKTEVEFEFINGTSNFRTSFNNPTMQGGFLLDVVVVQCATIFQLLTSKDQTLLIWWNAVFVLSMHV